MLVTGHWSASQPVRLRAYHEEFALTGDPFSAEELHALRALHDDPNGYKSVPWATVRPRFTLWKNDSFSTPTDYGTWDVNRDPRDQSPNIEIAAMCMGDATTTNFGTRPYTIAHAWMHAALMARVCQLKGIDTMGSFDASVEPGVLQNGPIFNLSSHGERAIQTINWGVAGAGASSEAASREFGYFLGSGDPSSRWDCLFLDPYYIGPATVATAKASAAWIRTQAHNIKAAGITDFWGLDGPETP